MGKAKGGKAKGEKAAEPAVGAPAPAAEPAAAEPTVTPAAPEAALPEAVTPKAGAKEVTVQYRDHRGEPVSRVFSKEVHGDNFKALADEFCETNAKQGARIVA
jgi:hypothetical protein